nr:tetratricopeptide repeat protein [uncultured bacterium]
MTKRKNSEDKKKLAQEQFSKAYELQMNGKISEATALYKESIDIYPTAEAYTFLGWAYSYEGLLDDAIKHCKKAIEIDPEFGNPYNDIGAYLLEKGKLDDAIPWFKKAMQAKRYDSQFYPHYNLGQVYERKGHWAAALSSYSEAFRLNSKYRLAEKAMNRVQSFLN